MAAQTNMITTQDVDSALSQEFVANFRGQYDRLAEILGIFSVETMAAGVTLYQYKITGELNTDTRAEGELVPLSHYTVKPNPVGSITPVPFRKMTTAEAILKVGYEKAVLGTDEKMASQMRAKVLNDFFTFLGNGTGAASGKTLQAALAYSDQTLQDEMEANGDESDGAIFHFVNRKDAADYLAEAPITTQTVFGMTYLQNFLGVSNVFLTSKVPAGTIYTTPVQNIHVYGIDWGALSSSGLVYETDSDGLIGVHHAGAYDYASAQTDAMMGATFLPEITDYIVKATIGTKAAASAPAGK